MVKKLKGYLWRGGRKELEKDSVKNRRSKWVGKGTVVLKIAKKKSGGK